MDGSSPIELDAESVDTPTSKTRAADEKIAWFQSLPYIGWHLLPLSLFFVGTVTWRDWVFCGVFYFARMFVVCGFYHRYFSHRTFKTSRAFQFIISVIGCTAIQKGPLWWAAHHRHHHKHSDDEHDIHSPRQKGFFWAHTGWILVPKYNKTESHRIRDFTKYPELVWLDKYWQIVPIVVGIALLAIWGWGTFAMAFLSTVFLWHGTYTINSLAHVFGKRRFETTDDSRNSFLLSLLTLGEGWHNNHHYYPGSCSQGFYWWEIDITYYGLKVLEKLGLVWGIRNAPERVLEAGRLADESIAN